MKKIIIALALCLFVLPLSAFNLDPSTNWDKDNSFFTPMIDMFSTGVNSGLAAATIPPRLLNIGFQANFSMNKNEGGILDQAGNTDNYFFPILYANLRIKDFIFIGRGLVINQKGVDLKYFGGGLGYIISDYKLFFPSIRILGAYHVLDASNQDFKISTATINAIADYKLPIPILSPHIFANVGYERNMLQTSWEPSLGANKDFGVNRVRFAVGARFSLFWILNLSYEYTVTPNSNHNLGLSVGF